MIKQRVMICLCIVILVFLVNCTKKPAVKGEENPEATQSVGEQTIPSHPDDPEEPWTDGSGETGFYPDISFYENLGIFNEYLDSLHSRSPHTFSFQVPREVQEETVIFKPLIDNKPVDLEETETYVIVTTEKVVMYEKPSLDSPVVTHLNRGDLFMYDYTLDFPENPEDEIDLHGELPVRNNFQDNNTSWGDLKGLTVNELFNNWHHISNNKNSGWVFGAYLHLDTKDKVKLMRELYLRGSVFPAYQDYFIEGSHGTEMGGDYNFGLYKKEFSPALQEKLKSEFIALERVPPSEINVSSMEPDDMVYLYNKLCESRMNPVLITTDFILHTLHLIFDRALQDIEKTYFLVYYEHLARMLFDKVSSYHTRTEHENLKNECKELMGFCAVALSLSGQITGEDTGRLDPEILEKMKDEVTFIEASSGFQESPLTGNLVDYSIFKPRGHYTLNKALTMYFKLMKWFGQIDFALTLPEKAPPLSNPTRKALILTLLLADSKDFMFYEMYCSVLDYIVGKSDNPTPIDYFNIISEMPELNTLEDLASDEILRAFIEKAKTSLPIPKISDTVMVQEMGGKDPEDAYASGAGIPGGFRLVSERYTLDADIFTQLSSPRIGTREHPRLRVKTWDIAHVFGSEIASGFLVEDMEVRGYGENLEKLTGETSGLIYKDWYSTFYSSFLRTSRQLLLFPNTTGVPYLDSSLYRLKNHLTFFSTYAELKHDTILYAKQPYAAELGGFMSYDYVRDSYPEPRGYIEPNLPFFKSLDLLSESLKISPAGEFLLSSNMGNSFKVFFDECAHLRTIVEKQVKFVSLSSDDYDYLFTLPRTFSSIILPMNSVDDMGEETDELRMAIVADIFTNATGQEVLEVATGTPSRMYMAVYDPSGGRRVCIGYTFTYYEFWQPIVKRLNDQEWRTAVYEDGPTDLMPLERKMPEWLNELYF
ncbi:MAG: DUF3160 domain-containing protein [Spirochaetales bacterium]|nr:DUF3160 domain-containing protein [Spirochaetales bacterium]